MEIKKIKTNKYKQGLNIREVTASGGISMNEWKRLSKKVLRLN